MKHIKILSVVLFFMTLTVSAQHVEMDGKNYVVENGKIMLDGQDVTDTFSPEQKIEIEQKFIAVTNEMKLKEKQEKEQKKIEKSLKESEKRQKQAEKKQKQAEKELRKKEKAQKSYDNSQKSLKTAQKKYERLKEKGKLSPEDERKWLDKIENLNEKYKKAEKRLRRS